MYIMDVICNRCYFGEVQEDVLGKYFGQGISIPRTEALSFYQWSVPENTIRVVEEYLCKSSTAVSGFVSEILEKSKVITIFQVLL